MLFDYLSDVLFSTILLVLRFCIFRLKSTASVLGAFNLKCHLVN